MGSAFVLLILSFNGLYGRKKRFLISLFVVLRIETICVRHVFCIHYYNIIIIFITVVYVFSGVKRRTMITLSLQILLRYKYRVTIIHLKFCITYVLEVFQWLATSQNLPGVQAPGTRPHALFPTPTYPSPSELSQKHIYLHNYRQLLYR